jgi:hypothetical protein
MRAKPRNLRLPPLSDALPAPIYFQAVCELAAPCCQ